MAWLENLTLLIDELLRLDVVASKDSSGNSPASVSFSHLNRLSQNICLSLHEVCIDGHSSICVDAFDLIKAWIAQIVLDSEENGL